MIDKHLGLLTVKLELGDITDLALDAIVNAANEQLLLGGGVAGAIRQKGGPAIQNECNQRSPIGVGEAVITTGGNLRAKHVIHAVGPRWGEGDEDLKLENAVRSSLRVAEENKLTSIAFPAISTGIYGFPVERAARIMTRTVRDVAPKLVRVRTLVFCLYTSKDYDVFRTAAEEEFQQN